MNTEGVILRGDTASRHRFKDVAVCYNKKTMEFLANFIAAILGGLVVVGAWLLTLGRKLQILDDLKEKTNRIESFSQVAANAIVEIQTQLAGRGFVVNQKLAYTPGSPLQLTEFGKTIIKESGFETVITDQTKRTYLINLVRAKNPQTNYDIQQFSMGVMKELADRNDANAVRLKEYAYQKGLPLEIVVNAAGIVLRDEVMKELKFSDSY
jgi:transcription initiation factor TFIIIB Brf1 subunit/transcription initiation factor TFIIB